MKKVLSMFAITVAFGLFATSCAEEEEKIESIQIESSETRLHVGDKGVLDISYTPYYLNAPICNWTSSDSSIIAIDCYTGEYSVKNIGTAVITVTTSDPFLTDQCQFSSVLYRSSMVLLKQNCSLYEDESIVLETSSYYTGNNFEWFSTDSSIAVVDENGKVTAVAEGVCYVCVATGDSRDYCKIVVEKFYDVEDVIFDVTEKEIELGEAFTITASIVPDNSSKRNLQWSSSDSTVAKVDDYGNVSTVEEGECYIYARSHNDKVAECRVVVLPASIKNVELSVNEIKLMPGESQKVEYSVTPSYAKITSVEWDIEDETVASITSDGVVTCNSIGSTKLKLILNKEISVECNIVGCEIDEFVEVKFGGGSIASINGYITGNIGFDLVNNSNNAIIAKKIQIIDGYTGRVSGTTNLNDVVMNGKSRLSYSARLNSIYKPIFRFYFSYNNKEYYTEKQYGI